MYLCKEVFYLFLNKYIFIITYMFKFTLIYFIEILLMIITLECVPGTNQYQAMRIKFLAVGNNRSL